MTIKRFDWDFFSKVPEHTRGALERYFLYGMEPGSFIKAVLCNDLYSSVSRADTWNKQSLADIVSWIAEHAPEGSWGHPEYYEEWISKGPAYQSFQKSVTWEALNATHTDYESYDF